MVEMTNELISYLRVFQKEFGDIVPLRELPSSVTTEELIEAVKISIEKNVNILPTKFGFDKLENDPDIII